MEFFLGVIAVLFCIAMALKGYLIPVLVGGFIGSFFGLAGFGGGISGMLPGAIGGAIIAIALKKNNSTGSGRDS